MQVLNPEYVEFQKALTRARNSPPWEPSPELLREIAESPVRVWQKQLSIKDEEHYRTLCHQLEEANK